MASKPSKDIVCQSCGLSMAVKYIKGRHYCQKCVNNRAAAMKEVKRRLKSIGARSHAVTQ